MLIYNEADSCQRVYQATARPPSRWEQWRNIPFYTWGCGGVNRFEIVIDFSSSLFQYHSR